MHQSYMEKKLVACISNLINDIAGGNIVGNGNNTVNSQLSHKKQGSVKKPNN